MRRREGEEERSKDLGEEGMGGGGEERREEEKNR